MKSHASMAVLADIHGNAFALEAVLADADRRGLARFVNLGDIFYGPLAPARTWEILKNRDIPTILGNQDRILLEGGPKWEAIPSFRAALEALSGDGMDWLASLPATMVIDDVLLCHGTPCDDTAYLLEDVTSGKPVMRQCQDIEADIPPVASGCSLILAGHSHFPGTIRCDGRTIVNPGSVGLPAYDDDTPPHAMAAGSPHARYSIVTSGATGWDVEFVSVEYDWQAAADLARKNGRDDWAQWLLTGVATIP